MHKKTRKRVQQLKKLKHGSNYTAVSRSPHM